MKQFENLKRPDQADESLAAFERELTTAFRPVAPPANFAQRTLALARVESSTPAEVIAIPRRSFLQNPGIDLRSPWIGGAIAATLLLSTFFAEQTHLRHEREAEQAQRQFEAGLRITAGALADARQQLQEAGIQLGR